MLIHASNGRGDSDRL